MPNKKKLDTKACKPGSRLGDYALKSKAGGKSGPRPGDYAMSSKLPKATTPKS